MVREKNKISNYKIKKKYINRVVKGKNSNTKQNIKVFKNILK
jgi:hypothetical protein